MGPGHFSFGVPPSLVLWIRKKSIRRQTSLGLPLLVLLQLPFSYPAFRGNRSDKAVGFCFKQRSRDKLCDFQNEWIVPGSWQFHLKTRHGFNKLRRSFADLAFHGQSG